MCAPEIERAKSTIAIMAKNAMTLAQNPYGNYTIQLALDFFHPAQYEILLESFRGKLAQLSLLKFSSNVVEKCLIKSEGKRRSDFLKELYATDKLLSIYHHNNNK